MSPTWRVISIFVATPIMAYGILLALLGYVTPLSGVLLGIAVVLWLRVMVAES